MIKREDYLQKLRQAKDEPLIKVVTGVRRSGKSTLLEMFREELIESGVRENQIIALNFEEAETEELLDRRKLSDYIQGKLVSGRRNYIFLDEIQNVGEFERLVDSLYVKKNVDVYITGSNAYLLSSELATLLSGRYIEISILPFSFREFLEATGGENGVDRAERFANYLHYSSFPQAVRMIDGKSALINDYLRGIYKSVLTKDIMNRRNIRGEKNFEAVLKFAFDSIGSAVSPNSIANCMASSGISVKRETIESYLSALTDSFVLYKADRWDIKGKRLLRTQEKYYAVDLGLRRVLLGRGDNTDLGHMLENVVYLELLRRGGEVYIGKAGDKEVDFVVKSPDGDVSYYQVAYSVMNEATLEREFAPLKRIPDNYPKYLITMDPLPFDDGGIKHINALAFLMRK